MHAVMGTLSQLGEAGLIEKLQAMSIPGRGVLQGIGDDAAVYDLGDGRVLLVTVDTMVAGGHFLPDRMPMHLVGRKAMMSSASDIVAMNGLPRCAVVALNAPGSIPVSDITALYEGLQEAAQELDLTLVGGDTTRSPVLTVSVTVIGGAGREDVVLRSGARPGDVLCVTGTLGASQAGLQWMLSGRMEENPACAAALQAHWNPTARLDVIHDWHARAIRPHALTDISDGLAAEIHHLCEASCCGVLVDVQALPVPDNALVVAELLGEDATDYALYWGEDYELVFALPESDLARLNPTTFTVIGHFTCRTESIRMRDLDGSIRPLERKGWEHYR